MKLELDSRRLLAFPFQMIVHDGSVILKRGALETRIEGARAVEVLQSLVDRIGTNGIPRKDLTEGFAAVDRPDIDALIDQLLERRLLYLASEKLAAVPESESPLDVFYWNIDQTASEVTTRLSERRIIVLGVNEISRQMLLTLEAAGCASVGIVDYPLLRNLTFFDGDGSLNRDRWSSRDPLSFDDWSSDLDPGSLDCLVATSDFGGLHWMRQWNEVCVPNRIHFLPVVLQNLIGYVGPIVVPGETACFECLRARQNAHMVDAGLRRAPELVAFEGQFTAGFHPAMTAALGSIAAMELTKLYGGMKVPTRRVGMLIEVNLLVPSLTARKVLKIPRCPICSPGRNQPAATASMSTFLPGNRTDQ
ncbi:MAG TPA: TOMM precursor leader peptide-binding protein [Vicinamibacterales bacterium]|nr:TOMM precursor leader peptide-binding protein [Vicinamibacterales bacterium]